jgi:hypothetical protein
LSEWANRHRGDLVAERPDTSLIAELRAVADREIRDAETVESSDGRLGHAHTASLAIAAAALAASGYRLRHGATASSSVSSVAKNASAIALSYALPTRPMDGRILASQAAPPEGQARVLTAAVGVMNEPRLGTAIPQGHVQRVDDQRTLQGVGYRPAHDAPAERLQYDRQVQPPAPGPQAPPAMGPL